MPPSITASSVIIINGSGSTSIIVAIFDKSCAPTLLLVTTPVTFKFSSSNSLRLSKLLLMLKEVSVFALFGFSVPLMVKVSENEL